MTLLNELLTKSSNEFPKKEAVVCGPKRLSYSEIEDASLRLANFLISHGINHGDRVGIFCNKDIEEVIIISAVLKIGAIFIYVNPQFKEEQLSYVIRDCDIKVLFVDEAKSRIFEKADPGKSTLNLVILLSSEIDLNKNNFYHFSTLIKSSSNNKIDSDKVDESDPASIIYTSGSTGKSKGIIVTHKIFYDSTRISAAVLENSSSDRLISVTPFSFDGALSQLFTMFMVGGTLIQQRSNFPKDIVSTLIQEKITGFHAVPSLWNVLLQKHSPFSNYNYPDLRYVSIIGENLPLKYLNIIQSILPGTQIYKMYGTTEAFRSTYLPPKDLTRKPNSVGVPFPEVEISIVDENNRICEPGEIGEIVHKGVFISPGYWNQPEKSTERFKYNSLYTGDLGKMDEEGYLYFAGRKDGMMKVQGYRVSPEEIEECLYQLKEVQEAVVISAPGENLDRKIKAVIVCNNNSEITEKTIISHCRNKLPSYMIPAVIEFRKFLPRTANNKVNKLELI